MAAYVHTLAYNIAELVEEATQSLYDLNDITDFPYRHGIIDLGYPLPFNRDRWAQRPKDRVEILYNQHRNATQNMDTCAAHGSEFYKVPNIGVSQNWTSAAAIFGVGPGDILIGADPDERPVHRGWVKAMAEAAKSDPGIAVVSLMLPELLALDGFFEKYIAYERVLPSGIRVWYGKAMCQWALIGITGDFIHKCGGVPYPDAAPRYGWIETAMEKSMAQTRMTWVMLPDYHVGHLASSPLAQQWKNHVVTEQGMLEGQISFEDWLLKP